MNAAILLVGLSFGLILGICLLGLAGMERVTRVEKIRPWRICWRCEKQVGENGNCRLETRVVCEDCTAAALKRVA